MEQTMLVPPVERVENVPRNDSAMTAWNIGCQVLLSLQKHIHSSIYLCRVPFLAFQLFFVLESPSLRDQSCAFNGAVLLRATGKTALNGEEIDKSRTRRGWSLPRS